MYDKKTYKAIITWLKERDYRILAEDFHGWIVINDYVDDELGFVFIKPIYSIGHPTHVNRSQLRDEFEEVAVAWLQAADSDCIGPIRCDLYDLTVISENIGFLKVEHDAINRG